MRWYDGLLRLYPASFREEFGEEMRTIVAREWARQRQLGCFFGWLYLLRETTDALRSVAREQAAMPRSPQQHARCIVRASSLVLGLFFVMVSLTGPSNAFQALMLSTALLLLLGLFSAWHFEAAGGIFTLGLALLLGLMLLSVPVPTSLRPYTALAALLYLLPYVLFGAMFVWLGQQRLSSGSQVKG